jgi:peptidoglycan/xylan/chitin deacetylase (PgdA/CDA1 family)
MSKNVSVCLSFDFDAISIWIGPMRSQSPSTISRGEFGAVGTERLLDTLRRQQILASWFIPGHTIETFPKKKKKSSDSAHEIGHHGYLHENPASVSPTRNGAFSIVASNVSAVSLAKAPLGYVLRLGI